jgi:MaoC dehydratase-like protein
MTNKILTDEMMKAVGFSTRPVTHEIEPGGIRKFARAIEDPNPLFRPHR